jgi:ATP-dependent Clp protease protease subunit
MTDRPMGPVRPVSPVTAAMPPPRPGWRPSPPSWPPFPQPPEPETVPGPARTQLWLRPPEPPSVYESLLRRRIVLAHGHLDDEAATRLCAQLLTLDAEGDGAIRLELQGLSADLTAAVTMMGVLDTVGAPVQARAAGRTAGAALGVLAACPQRAAYPNALFALTEPTEEFGGTVDAVTAREQQTRTMTDALYERLAEVTGHEIDEVRAAARAGRLLSADDAVTYGLVGEVIAGRRETPAAPRRSAQPHPGQHRPEPPRPEK